MSILIKGLTIPPDSDVAGSVSLTIIRAHDGSLFAEDIDFHFGETKARGYDAIELLPHGDLIDRNDLVKWIITEIADYSEDDKAIVTKTLKEMLPTIIESEGEDGTI